MMLVDKELKELINSGTLIVEGYDSKNLGSVSYDLTIDKIISFAENDSIEHEHYELSGNEYIIIKTKEKLQIPHNLLGKIEEKNSVMRMGLIVNGPCYQPGHETYAFLRVLNISKHNICLESGFKIAQIMFEELKTIPEITYDQKKDASFNNELKYRGFGNYEQDYMGKIL